ncbi:MAG TPA: hypothetical protein PLL36_01295 [Candidatus Hydrogenedentes bacterium]|nr:hypothetical protein [Candidatus Hydrogenedentota bacterium]
MLKGVKALQIVWSFLLLIIFGVASMVSFVRDGNLSYIHLALTMVAMVYVGAAFLGQYNNRIAWWISLPIPAIYLFLYLPGVVLNIVLFLAGNEKYLDSPATIFIVLIYALVFVLPPLAIYYGLFRNRKVFLQILFAKGEGWRPVENIERLLTLEGLKRLQLAWSMTLLLYYGYYFIRLLLILEFRAYYVIMFSIALAYFVAAVKCFINNRVAWLAALLLPLGPLLWHLYIWGQYEIAKHSVSEVDFAFLTRYYATIKPLLFFILPMVFLYYHFFHERKRLADILRRGKPGSESG